MGNPYAASARPRYSHQVNQASYPGAFPRTSQLNLAGSGARMNSQVLQPSPTPTVMTNSGPVLCPDPIRAVPSPPTPLKRAECSGDGHGLTCVSDYSVPSQHSLPATSIELNSVPPTANVGANSTTDPRWVRCEWFETKSRAFVTGCLETNMWEVMFLNRNASERDYMTIFYNGTMHVYPEITPQKVLF